MSFQSNRKIYILIGVLLVLTTLIVLTYNKVGFSGFDLGGNVGGALSKSRVVFERRSDETLPVPKINRLPSRIKGKTFTLKGTTIPGAKVTAIGGPYDLPPVEADAKGNFAIRVSLQEAMNQYSVKVEKSGEFAPSVTVYLLKNTGGLKATAPKEPKTSR